jgi:predicted nucleotidyltransferase
MEKNLEFPLQVAISILEKSGYRYALIGGMALSQWGIVRATYDIDIKVLVPDLDYKKIRSLLKSAFPQAARQKAPENPFIVAAIINDVIVDFLLALPGYEELIIERAIRHDMGEWKIWICSAEDLIIQKVVAGREKDLQDVQSILVVQHDKLDYKYIEEWLSRFVEALDNEKLLKNYHSILEKANKIQDKSA